MLTYFPKFFTSKSIAYYAATLALVSLAFMSHVLPFQFILFGFVEVVVFFVYSNRLTMQWQRLSPMAFSKKLFSTTAVIRLVYVVFIYIYYLEMTGQPHAYQAGDELIYQGMASEWHDYGFDVFRRNVKTYIDISDSGYHWWLGFEYMLLGTSVLPVRLIKCFIDAYSCVLIYHLATRNFGEAAGRMAAVFYMLMPNAWFYCGVTLKETEMAFMVILFAERADLAFRSPQIKVKDLLVPLAVVVVMFAFRTALAAVLAATIAVALVFSSKKQLNVGKKILYSAIFAVWMFMTIGVELVQETKIMYESHAENQRAGYEWRAEREGGNTFAKYASATLFAPLIFTIPFPTMVNVPYQGNQMMLNGGNFIKNVMSGFTIFAVFLLVFRKQWREHVLLLALMCGYLLVLVFSNFAQSERFHFPVLALELMFAAYGITQVTVRQKRWFSFWLIGLVVANVIWAWVKLAGRGMV